MQETNLDGKVVLVTGAARRIGAAIVTRLHAEGARLAIHYRSSSADAEKLADTLNAFMAAGSATWSRRRAFASVSATAT